MKLVILVFWSMHSFHLNRILTALLLTRMRAGRILRSFLSRDTETLVRAFTTYVRPLLEFCTPIWSPSLVGMIVHVESVQRTFTKKLPYMKYLTYKDRLSVLRLESLELRRLKADLIMCFKILKGYTNITLSELFMWSSSSTRGHSMKLYYPDSRVTARQHFSLFVLFNYGIDCRNRWYQPVVLSGSYM